MDTDGRPPARDAAKQRDGRKRVDPERIDPGRADPRGPDPAGFERRRRARNWALLAVLLGLSALFYAITLVKLHKGG